MIKRRARIQPADEAKLYIESASDKPGLMQRFINADKGRGVFAAQPIDPGAFVLEYRGKLISAEECQSRLYTERESTFLFEFQWQNQQWCLDASKEDGSLGRLVNDNDKSPNCTMKKIIVKDKPHLCLFAVKRIEPGTEIDYNYGDVKWPWRKKVGTEEFPAARVESSTALIEEISRDQDGSIQVGTEEFPAARVESSTALIEEISRDQDGSIQIAVVQGISLVNYSESESDEDSVKNCSITPHSDDVLQTNSRKKTILDGVPNVPDPLYDSNESIVEESDDEVVPKLRRTKSILMERLPLSDALFDSSDDTTEDLSTSKSDRASERQRRYCYPSLVGTDNTSGESEEEYVPNPNEESTDSDGSSELSVKGKDENKTAPLSQSARKSLTKTSFVSRSQGKRVLKTSFENRSQGESSQSGGFVKRQYSTADVQKEQMEPLVEEPSVYVNPVMKKEDGSRKYNKKHYCLYCGVLVQKMSRHLLRRHQDEIDVAKAFSLPKNSKERRLQLDYIRNRGNFEHNTQVLENHKGKLIPSKQPKEKTEGEEFTHCVYCYGLYTKRVMWRHFQSCKLKPQDNPSKKGKTRVQALCAFAEPVPSDLSDAYWKFLSEMNQDKIVVAIKSDRCILDYGFRFFNKNRKIISQHQYIRQKLRELGRLLLEVRKVAPVKSIKELIKPEKYKQVVSAARCLTGFCDDTGKYQCPSLARKVGHSLHSLAMFIKSEGLKMKDKQAVQDAEEFAQLYQESWKFDIASQALTQLDQTKWNSPQLLPFTKDVQNLHCYLTEQQHQCLIALKEDPSSSNWKDLAKVTLAQVILFNRRRAGEVSRMPLSMYLSKDSSETHEDVNLALTALEQKLCQHFVRITIVGKRGRKVPVLLTPLMRESLDALTEKREECGVLSNNGYLFALPHSAHYLRGSDCIRQFVNDCSEIKNPKALTSTKLRKHIATLSTVLNLKTTELDQLADFLGHNIEVHRKHYRLPEGTLQLAKISKVLLAMEQGRLGEYKGKSLDEIQLDVNESVDMDSFLQEGMEDADLPKEQEKECDLTSPQEDTDVPETHGSEDEVDVRSLQECSSTANELTLKRSVKKRGKKAVIKRSWTPEESAAVNKHLRKFIVMNQVPGKEDCERCIAAEPDALRTRDWKAVKYFIKNRITAVRRKLE